MEKTDIEKIYIEKMLREFRKDFDLNFAELEVIAKRLTPGLKERVEKIDEIRRGLKGVVKSEPKRGILFAHNEILGDSYFNLMVKGYFDKVIEDIAAFREGVHV